MWACFQSYIDYPNIIADIAKTGVITESEWVSRCYQKPPNTAHGLRQLAARRLATFSSFVKKLNLTPMPDARHIVSFKIQPLKAGFFLANIQSIRSVNLTIYISHWRDPPLSSVPRYVGNITIKILMPQMNSYTESSCY